MSDNGHLAVSTDGRRLLTRTGGFRETKEFTIWDTVTGRRLWSKTLENSEDPRHFATTVFSPDLRYLLLMVSVENNRQATLFDVDRNEKVRDVEFEGTAAYTAVFRSDGKQLLTAHMEIREDSEADDESAKCHVVLWDIANKEALQVLPFHSGVGRISFARDGARFATTAPLVTDQETTGDNMELTMPSRPEEVPESIWRQYEQLLARSRNEELEFQPSILKSVVWDSETGKEVASLLTVGRNVSALTFSPGGDALLTKTVLGEKMESLSSDQVDVWDVASGKRTVSLPRQRFDIAMHQFGPRGGNLLTAGTDFRSTQIILWDLETGERLREFQGPDASSKGVSLSADGRYVAAAYTQSHAQNGGRTIVWDAATGKRVFDLATPTTDVSVLDVRHDGELVLSVHENYQDQPSVISLWSPDGSLIRNLPTDSMMVRSASFSPSGEQVVYSTEQGVFVKSALTDADAATIVSREVKKKKNGKQRKPGWFSASDAHLAVMSPDGRRVLVADEYFAQLRNAASGALVESYYGPQGGAGRQGIQNAVVTPDGEYVLTVGAARDGGAELMLWDGPSGRLLKRLQGHSDMVQCVAISPDGKRAITGGWDAKAILWDIPSGQIIRELSNIEYIVWNVAISPDGKRALTGSGRYEKFGEMILWDLETGRKLRTFKDHKNYVGAVAFTPDGRSVLSGSWDGDAILWDAASGRKSRTFSHADEQQVYSACFTPDGRQLLTGCSLNSAVLWDVATGRRLRTLAGHHEFVWEVDISPDGRYAATASADHTVSLWDLKSGVRLKTYDGLTQWATAAQFTADGKRLLTSSPQAAAHLIDVASFEPVVTFEAHQGRLQCLAFSPQGAEVFTAASDGGIIQWAADTGASLHRFYGHTYQVTSLDASADGRFLISGSQDGTARLWDANSGQEVVRLIQFRGGDDWVALTPEGLFDGSPGGREKVMFRVGGELDVVPVDRFFQDFYYPGLLTAISAGERPLPQVELPTSHPPLVRIASPKAGGDTSERELELIVEATDQGGGLKGPWLTQNGARVLPSASEVRNGEVVRRTFRVALIEGENHFEALAASADGSWESEPVRMHLAYREKTAEAQLYVISVGVSEYSDESLNLQFAAKDAEAFGDLFRRRASRLFGQDRVHVASLTDGRGTKESIRYTFKVAAERAQPQDVMILFLAGHGAMVGQRYYFIPHDFRPKSSQLEDDIREQGIPADELNDLISAVPALKRVVIYDTCQSGGALALRYRARSAFAFRGALERMARATGSFTLAATSASEEAAEIDDLGHGALTYALLAGAGAVDVGPLKKQRLDTGGEVVNVRDWFNYAQDKVPVVTKAFLGQEQFVTSSGSGTSFPLLPSPAPD
ncbi:MAG: caspase family protein [Pirellulaceae bacterium]